MSNSLPFQIQSPNKVAIVRVNDYSPETVRAGLLRIMELLRPEWWLQSLTGKTVFLKPNIVFFLPLAYTNPVIVDQLAQMLHEKGADVQLGDSTITKSATDLVQKNTPFPKIAIHYEHPIVNFFDQKWLPVIHPSFLQEKEILLPEAIVHADIVINLPKMKTHGGMLFSGAIKNFFGCHPDKQLKHEKYRDKAKFQQFLGDIHQAVWVSNSTTTAISKKDEYPPGIPKPVLHIMDGIIAMEGFGPTAGTPKSYHVLIGGFSPTAVDIVAMNLMGGDPTRLETIQSLATRNNWARNIDELEILGDNWKDFRKSARFPPVSRLVRINPDEPKIIQYLLWITNPTIQIDENKCKLCGICEKECPMHAIAKFPTRPKIRIDQKKCIGCFCCGEFCPNHAIRTQKRIMRFIQIIGKFCIFILGGIFLIYLISKL